MNLREAFVQSVHSFEERRFDELMNEHHSRRVAQDKRDLVVCRYLARLMGRLPEFFGRGAEVRGLGSICRVVLSPPVRPAEAYYQLQPYSDPSRMAFSEPGFPRSDRRSQKDIAYRITSQTPEQADPKRVSAGTYRNRPYRKGAESKLSSHLADKQIQWCGIPSWIALVDFAKPHEKTKYQKAISIGILLQ